MAVDPLNVYIVTYNCGRVAVDVETFAEHLLGPCIPHHLHPDLVVLSLQEIAPIGYSFLGGSHLTPYFSNLIAAVHKAAAAAPAAGPNGPSYQLLLTHNIGLTALIVLARSEICQNFQYLTAARVGVGYHEMGNKGALGVRLAYHPSGRTSRDPPLLLTFVAAHLYPFEDGVERRNLDWKNIVRGLAFVTNEAQQRQRNELAPSVARGTDEETEPLLADQGADSLNAADQTSDNPHVSGMFAPDTLLFFAGDLNYRASNTSPSPDDHLTFPQPHIDSPSDPRYPPSHLAHDQLNRERLAGRTLHGLTEPPVTFPPTYKYSSDAQTHTSRHLAKSAPSPSTGLPDEPDTWQWATHRFPSWCDRILFSSFLGPPSANEQVPPQQRQTMTQKDPPMTVLTYTTLPNQPTSDHRPVALLARIDVVAAQRAAADAKGGAAAPPASFGLNPRWRRNRARARLLEMLVGLASYLGLTWKGRGVLMAMLVLLYAGRLLWELDRYRYAIGPGLLVGTGAMVWIEARA